MRRMLLWLITVCGLLLAGCTDPVVFSEVFQQQVDQKIYTACNLWYTNPEEISCLNIQEGKFIPIGTEIVPERTTYWGDKIIFRDTAGQQYTIKFDPGYRITSMNDYIAQTFTTQTPEQLFEGISPAAAARIRRGEVVPGMTRREVLLAYGHPAAIRTPNLRNESWIYWTAPNRTVRVVFRGDNVRNILNDYEN